MNLTWFPTEFVYAKSSYKENFSCANKRIPMGKALVQTKWQQPSMSFTNRSTGLLYVRGDTMAELQLGVTHSNLGRQRQKSDAKNSYHMLVSQQETSQSSEFDKIEKWQPTRSGILTSSGKSSIPYTSLFRNLAEFNYRLPHIQPSMSRQGKTDSQLQPDPKLTEFMEKFPWTSVDCGGWLRSGFGQMLISEVLHVLEKTPFSILVRGIYVTLLLCHSKLWITQDSTLT